MINVTVTSRPTIRKVAERAGVSRMTVSRVLGDRNDLVSEETRRRVLDVVRELEYVPVAQPMMQSRKVETRIIGLVFDLAPIEGPFGIAIFIGLRESAKKYDYDLLTLVRDAPEWMNGREELQFLNRQCDGVIFISPAQRYKTIETLSQHNIPVVCCHTNDVPAQIPCVLLDNFGAMYQMTQHLIENGHTNIMHVGSCMIRPDFAEREAGYRKAMLDAGLQPVVYNLDYRNEVSLRGFLESMERHNTTAFNCVSDAQAFCVWDVMMVQGMRVPQDISITGMDNIRKEVVSRGLTTIVTPLEESGTQAFGMMMELMDKGYGSVEDVTLPVQLVKRTSVRNIS